MLARLATRSGLARCAGLARGGLGGAALRARLASSASAAARLRRLGGLRWSSWEGRRAGGCGRRHLRRKMAVDVGSVIQADRVLLVGSESATIIGSP